MPITRRSFIQSSILAGVGSLIPQFNVGFGSDNLIDQFVPGELTVIGGRPSIGKTGLAIEIIQKMAFEQGEPVLYVSHEMSAKSFLSRCISSVSGIPQKKLRDGELTDHEQKRLSAAFSKIAADSLSIDAESRTVSEVRSQIALTKSQPKIIILDYLQLIRAGEYPVLYDLKFLALELDIPVVVLAQLNRSLREDNRPTLGDFRYRGSLLPVDNFILLHRESYYKEGWRSGDDLEMKLVNGRNGLSVTQRQSTWSNILRI